MFLVSFSSLCLKRPPCFSRLSDWLVNSCLQLNLSEWTQASIGLRLREKLLVNKRRHVLEKQRLESMIDIHSHLVAKRTFIDSRVNSSLAHLTELDFLVECEHCLNTSHKSIIDYSNWISSEDQFLLVNHIEQVNDNETLRTSFSISLVCLEYSSAVSCQPTPKLLVIDHRWTSLSLRSSLCHRHSVATTDSLP